LCGIRIAKTSAYAGDQVGFVADAFPDGTKKVEFGKQRERLCEFPFALFEAPSTGVVARTCP
jgi:hypothetical protein